MKQDITETPTALAGITPSTRYTLQNKTRLPVLFEVADSEPADDSGAFVLQIAKDDGAAVVSAPSGSICMGVGKSGN